MIHYYEQKNTSFINPKALEKRFVYFKDPSVIHMLAERFIDALHPLIKADKLGVLLFQYPPLFHYGTLATVPFAPRSTQI